MITGKLQQITTRPFGNKTMYNIKVNGDWYGCGDTKPKANEGDEVEFEFTQRGNFKNVDMKTFSAKTATSAPASSGSKDEYWKNKEAADSSRQQVIEYQAARNSAIAVVSAALQAQAVVLPKKNPLSAILALVAETTDRFFMETRMVADGEYNPQGAPDAVPFDADKDEMDE